MNVLDNRLKIDPCLELIATRSLNSLEYSSCDSGTGRCRMNASDMLQSQITIGDIILIEIEIKMLVTLSRMILCTVYPLKIPNKGIIIVDDSVYYLPTADFNYIPWVECQCKVSDIIIVINMCIILNIILCTL